MTTETQIQAATDMLHAIGHMDIAKIGSLMTADAKYWVLGHSAYDQVMPREQFMQTLEAVGKNIFDGPISFTVQGVTAGQDRVALEVASKAKLNNGGDYANLYHFLFEFDGNLIQLVREYADTAVMAKAFTV